MQEYLGKLRERYVTSPVKWLTIVGLIVLIVGAFGDWATVSIDLGDLGIGGISGSTGGFDENGTLTFILALVGLGAIAAYVYTNVNIPLSGLMWGLVAGAVVIDLLLLFDFLDIVTEDTPEGVDISVGWGLWLSIIGAIALSVGAVVPMWSEIRSRAEGMRRA